MFRPREKEREAELSTNQQIVENRLVGKIRADYVRKIRIPYQISDLQKVSSAKQLPMVSAAMQHRNHLDANANRSSKFPFGNSRVSVQSTMTRKA